MTSPAHRSFAPSPVSAAAIKRLLLICDRMPQSRDDFRSAWILDFVDALRRRSIQPEVLTITGGQVVASIGVPVYRVENGESAIRFAEPSAARLSAVFRVQDCLRKSGEALVAHLQQHQYDHILAIGAFPAGVVAARACERIGAPFSVWSLGAGIHVWARKLIFGTMVRRSLRRATALFADGDKLCEEVTATCGRECRFMPTLRRFQYKMLPIPREKVFLYVGALETSRGVFDLLKAFAQIKQDIWDYRLWIVGSGSKADKVQRAINQLHERGKVHLLGNLSNEELINYLQRAHALVIPSHDDSIPLVFGEALQAATPMIVTNAGDLNALVHDNKLGFIARRKSPASLSDAMVRSIVTDLDIRANCKHLLQRLAPENAVEMLMETLNTESS